MKPLNYILLLFAFTYSLSSFAQTEDVFVKRDLSEILHWVVSKTDSSKHDKHAHHLWEEYLNRPHPSVNTLHFYFRETAEEFQVPVEILMAIAQVESNWTQIGPSIDKGWGIMHLVDNTYSSTLIQSAELIDLDPQVLKVNARQNIRGMAALIAFYAKEKREELLKITDWFEILKPVTGLANEDLQELQVYEYYQVIEHGNISTTLWDEKIILKGQEICISEKLNPKNPFLFPVHNKTGDYPDAIDAFTSCNFAEGRNHEIDAWVNHWIGTGTYAGAISWFQNCDAQVSAHFVIRCNDGEISQVVGVENTAWHCGASGYPFNNSRSIGVEHEATLANPDQWNSMLMLEASANMASYFCDEFGIPKALSLPGIRAHDQMPGTNTMCPGNLPWGIWMGLLDENFSEVDLVIMDMWTEPENPDQGEIVEFFVEIGNVGNTTADTVILDFRVENAIVEFDTTFNLEANSTQQLSLPNYQFANAGIMDFCVYIAPHSQELNILNNSYCIEIEVNPVFAINEINNNFPISIFPNPTSGKLHFQTDKKTIKQVEIYNTLGVKVYHSNHISDKYFNVDKLDNGFYIIRFIDANGHHFSLKFQKE